MKNILDWIFEENKYMLIWSVSWWWISSYSKEDIEFVYNKWLSFSLLRELYNLETVLEMYYYQDNVSTIIDEHLKYKIICDRYWIDIKHFIHIDIFIEKMGNKYWEQKDSKNKKWYIYIIKSWGYYKIWKTINLNNRVKKYITENPNEIELIHSFESDDYTKQEFELHLKFKEKNYNREWFMLDADDILFLKSL